MLQKGCNMGDNLTLKQHIGHRLLVGLKHPYIDASFTRMVAEYKISNVILMPRNIVDKSQLAGLCADIQSLVKKHTGQPALIGIDQEGGTVVRFPKDATNVPGAMAIACTGRPNFAYQAGLLTGAEMRELGINFDFAPVMDINSNPKNPVIGERSYGDTAKTVIDFGLEMMRGLTQSGVLCCAKHFPGHGDTQVDSHLALPVIEKTLPQLEEMELKPFAAAIAAGVPAIMTSHILMPKIEPNHLPNTLSRNVITNILRNKMGFAGTVVSDCLEMDAIAQGVGTEMGALMAARAGVDLLCISHTQEKILAAAKLLLDAAQNGSLLKEEIEASTARILALKQSLPAPGALQNLNVVGCKEHRNMARSIRRAAITCASGSSPLPPLGKNPVFIGSLAYRATIASSPLDQGLCFANYMSAKIGGRALRTPINPAQQEIKDVLLLAKTGSSIIFGSYNGQFQPGQKQLILALCQLGLPFLHIALRSPYDLAISPKTAYKLAAFEYSEECFEVLTQILLGKLEPSGKLSFNLEAMA